MSVVTSTTVRTVPDADGWKLLGPLTSTFTPPPNCSKIISTTSDTLAFLGTDYFNRASCFPSSHEGSIRVYFRPGLACPAGWTSNLVSGSRTRSNLPSIGPDETVAVCCPSGLGYTETVLSFAPGVGGWCLGTLTAATTIEPSLCANCEGTPTPLPMVDADGAAVTLVQTTILFRSETAAAGADGGPSLTSSSSTGGVRPPDGSSDAKELQEDGLSAAAKTGIAVGAVIAGILLTFALGAFFTRQRRQKRQAKALQSLNEAKEVDGTSASITELLGDTNPYMKTHELGKGADMLSVVPAVYVDPVELDAGSVAPGQRDTGGGRIS